jgi:hypothetical protein
MREVDDAESPEKLRDRITTERDEPPEDERVRKARQRPFLDRLPLQDDIDQKAPDAEGGILERDRMGSGSDQADAGRNLRCKRADEPEDEQPEDQRRRGGYSFSAVIIAGTISNRSPTMPKSATSKIGASGSLLMATIVLAPFIPTRC